MLHGGPARYDTPSIVNNAARNANLAGSELGNVLALLRRYWWLVLLCSLLGATAFGAFALALKHRYQSTAQILIDPRDLRLLDNEVSPRSNTSESGIAVVESQVQVISSENVLTRAIKSLGLIDDPEYNGTRISLVNQLASAIVDRFAVRRGVDGEPAEPLQYALRTLHERTQFRRTERTYVVDVTTWAESRDKAARIANGIVQAYLEEQGQTRSATARGAGEAITSRLDGLRQNVSAAEGRISNYKAERHLINTGGTAGRLVNEQQISEINNQLTLARAETGRLKARFDETRSTTTSPDTLPEAVRSDTLRALRTQLSTVSSLRARMAAQLQPAHPDMKALDQQEQQVRRLIAEELRRIVTASQRDYLRAKAGEDALAQNLEVLRLELNQSNEAQVQLRELERDLESKRTVYQAALLRAREAKEQSELNTSNAQIISTAYPAIDRSFPPPARLLVPAGLLLGAGLGGALALLSQLLGWRRPIHGVAPSRASEPAQFVFADFRGLCKGLNEVGGAMEGERSMLQLARSVVDKPETMFARKIEDLDRVLEETAGEHQAGGEAMPRVVIFAPNRTNEAKSAVALALTYAAIKRGANVLLIDGDPQGRQLSNAIGCNAQTGLEDVLSGKVRLSQAVIADNASHLGFLPAVGRSGFLASPTALRRAIDDMADYDLVVIDGTPLGIPGIGQALSDAAGEVLFVFGAGPSADGDVTEAMHVLRQSTSKFRGIVLTD